MMNESLVYAALAVTLALPALPAALELRARRDATALALDPDYAADPRYLGKSFRRKIAGVLRERPAGSDVRFLDRANERARIVDECEVRAGAVEDCALLARGGVVVGQDARITDLFSAGSIRVGRGTLLRALVADADISLAEGVTVARFLDAQGEVTIGPRCVIGYAASAGGTCRLAERVAFHRLFGNPVVVGKLRPQFAFGQPAGVTIDSDTISQQSVEIAADSLHTGSIKSGGDVVVRAHACVGGNIIARGSVHVGTGAMVGGHIYSERDVVLGYEAAVGAQPGAKTVYASGNVTLFPGVRVHGWIICEGQGETR